MTKKEFIILANGYINYCNRKEMINKLINPCGIYIDDGKNPLVIATENIFNDVNDFILDCLFELKEKGRVEFFPDGEFDNKVTVYSIEELAEYFSENNEKELLNYEDQEEISKIF